MSIGYNWRSTLSDFAATSGVLAGFSITFIALILSGSVADVNICNTPIKFSHIAILLFGFSTALFIAANELFLRAKEFDVFSIPDRYIQLLKDDCELRKEKWEDFEDKHTKNCLASEQTGRWIYNIAITTLLIGLFFSIAPYNLAIAILVMGVGIVLEIWQVIK